MNNPKLRLAIPWESIEPEARRQILNVLDMPELECLAVMPDVHVGYDLCIGGVALLRGAVSPSFVGYDIGCGMCHVNTGKTRRELGLDKPGDRRTLFGRLQAAVPAGVGGKNALDPDLEFASASGDGKLDAVVRPSLAQMATLGSGNHFLEIGENKQGEVGVTVHSGSRRAGYDIAGWYMKKGRLLPLKSDLGKAYLADMDWALDFALENRRRMLSAALAVMGFSGPDILTMLAPGAMINENHNHAVRYGDNLMLHRKGATPAGKGRMGVIPANQRDGVWITRGLGNREFLCSASHGAGRAMSRKAAMKAGSVADLERAMKGIVCRTDKGVLDEAPWAYKRMDAVLAAQDGVLVDVVDHFAPLIVLKG